MKFKLTTKPSPLSFSFQEKDTRFEGGFTIEAMDIDMELSVEEITALSGHFIGTKKAIKELVVECTPVVGTAIERIMRSAYEMNRDMRMEQREWEEKLAELEAAGEAHQRRLRACEEGLKAMKESRDGRS